MESADILLESVHVKVDFHTISSATWHSIQIGSLLVGAAVGFVLQRLFKKAGFSHSSCRLQTFSGGCLLPVFVALVTAIGIDRLIPDCPDCGFTPDAIFIPLVVFPLMTLSAVAVFFTLAWRR